jgi:hypothetical protein
LIEGSEENNPALRKILKITSTAVTSRHFFVPFFAFNVNQSILMCFDNMKHQDYFSSLFIPSPLRFSHLFDFRSKASKMRAEINIIQPRGKKGKKKNKTHPRKK